MFSTGLCKLHEGADTTKEARKQQRPQKQRRKLIHSSEQFSTLEHFSFRYDYIITVLLLLLLVVIPKAHFS